MDTTKLQTFSLRGIDQRWLVEPQDALNIEDMTWLSHDSWKTSGGFFQLFEPTAFSPELRSSTEQPDHYGVAPLIVDKEYEGEETGKPFSEIISMHWFAQQNGGRQWLVYEEANWSFHYDTNNFFKDGTSSLKVFDGSLHKPLASRFTGSSSASSGWLSFPSSREPSRVLKEYVNPLIRPEASDRQFRLLNDRSANKTGIRTQSQTFGGRLYLCNGSDETLVFDGEICERAGFLSAPPPPSAMAGSADNSCTYPIAYGDSDDNFKDDADYAEVPENAWFFSYHGDIPYWGLGSRSMAEIGTGSYELIAKGDALDPVVSMFHNPTGLRFAFYAKSQLDTRKAGFQYKVTYVNDRGQESEASQSSNLAVCENGVGGTKHAMHGKGVIGLQLPIGPKECVARRIYRTRNCYSSTNDLYSVGRNRSFYFLAEVPDNMSTSFLDGHPDSILGDLLDTRDLGNFPRGTKFLANFKNTMFAAGHQNNEIRYSAPLFPESYPDDHRISIGDDDGGPIMGVKATKNALVVFKHRGIYLIKGDPRSGFVCQTLNKDVGCVSPDSISELPGIGLIFLSERGMFVLEGALENTGTVTGVVNIGAEIPNILERVNSSAAVRACSGLFLEDNEYWISLPVDGSKENNICLIYHYSVGAWSIRKNFPAGCMVTSKDHRGYLFMGSNDTTNKFRAGILIYSRGAKTKGKITTSITFDGSVIGDDVNIDSKYETVSNDYSSVFTNFRPAHVIVYGVQQGDNELSVNTRVNRSIDQLRMIPQSNDQQDPNDPYPVYGSAFWGSSRWMAYRPTLLRYDIDTSSKGPVRELSIEFSSGKNKFEIIGYDLEAKVGGQNNIKALNKALRSDRR
jgi:hypothetical protein|tara:strand:+ start:74 stop:2626 length:2553 start_codon:yes stop_codon:yes gene_type:complete